MKENVATDNSIFARTENEVIKPEYFDFIGQAHNQGLEYVFKNSIRGNSNLVYSDIKNASLHYFDKVYELTLNKAASNYSLAHDKIVRKSVEANSIFIENGNYSFLSEKELFFLNKLNVIVTNDKNLSSKLSSIESLNQEIYNSDLEDNQLARLYMTNSVAKHSLTYWSSDKAEKWFDLFQPDNVAAKVNWDNVVTADIAAFLMAFPSGVKAGAIRGAIVLGLSSGGTGAIPGAIIGAIGGGCAAGITAAVSASGCVLAAETLWNGW